MPSLTNRFQCHNDVFKTVENFPILESKKFTTQKKAFDIASLVD